MVSDCFLDTPAGVYRWIENWIVIPESPLSVSHGRTHGVAVTRDGRVILFHQGDPAVLIYDASGQLLDRWGNFPGAHGMTLVEEEGSEFLWLTDQTTCEVVKTTLTGRVTQRIEPPDHLVYREKKFIPTEVAVNERGRGGNGDIWVTDGYGAYLVHRYNADGQWLDTLTGEEGAGAFKCPHGIRVDTRQSTGRLYIADRANCRAQVYDLEGRFERVFGTDFFTSPNGFIAWGDRLIVPELKARLTILDADDRLVTHVGLNDPVCGKERWPNHRDWVEPGRFNSPHAAAPDAEGNLYVVEWITGGRVIKLERIA